jgi:hypothetical protein
MTRSEKKPKNLFNDSILGFTDISMSEPEEKQQHQQPHGLPVPSYEASQE